jgi:4-hydroxybenzoate polyprenyltransferase
MCFGVTLSNLVFRGWDNTGANGANLSFPKEFGIEDNTWLVGVINAGYVLLIILEVTFLIEHL